MLLHGTHSAYVYLKCRCAECRAARARYMKALRDRKRAGRVVFGQLVPATEAWQRVRSLQLEGLSREEQARRLGLVGTPVHAGRRRIRLRTLLRLRWLSHQLGES